MSDEHNWPDAMVSACADGGYVGWNQDDVRDLAEDCVKHRAEIRRLRESLSWYESRTVPGCRCQTEKAWGCT